MDETLNSENNLPSIGDILANIDGIPLPTEIKKSLWKSIGRLINGLVDVPVAYLEAKAKQIHTEADALALVTKYASEAAAKEFISDPQLIQRSISHFSSRLFREQMNREKTMQLAIEDLQHNPPKVDSNAEIDLDWLEMFSRIAETRSNADVQLFLSKILAGEIRRPGSFSLKTIQTLSTLDQNTARTFQSVCNISFEIPAVDTSFSFVICDPFGSPGDNALTPLGLTYLYLAELQDAGLIQSDLNAWRNLPIFLLAYGIKIGDSTINLINEFPNLSALIENDTTNLKTIRTHVINFTIAGQELRKVIHLSSNEIYIEKFKRWMNEKLEKFDA